MSVRVHACSCHREARDDAFPEPGVTDSHELDMGAEDSAVPQDVVPHPPLIFCGGRQGHSLDLRLSIGFSLLRITTAYLCSQLFFFFKFHFSNFYLFIFESNLSM